MAYPHLSRLLRLSAERRKRDHGSPKRPQARSTARAPGKWLARSLADHGSTQELAALVEHGLFDDLIGVPEQLLLDALALA
jgi:hypothetical protein